MPGAAIKEIKKTMRRDNPWQIKEGKIKVVQKMIDW